VEPTIFEPRFKFGLSAVKRLSLFLHPYYCCYFYFNDYQNHYYHYHYYYNSLYAYEKFYRWTTEVKNEKVKSEKYKKLDCYDGLIEALWNNGKLI